MRMLLLLAVALCLGCGGNSDSQIVSGLVTYQGQPVEKATVRFYPAEGGRSSTGRTDQEGRYQLTYTREQQATPNGKYVVTIEAKIPDPNSPPLKFDERGEPIGHRPMVPAIPQKYFDRDTSGLNATVGDGDGTGHNFDL